MTDLRTLPAVLVARGCLAPYFLRWWKRWPAPLHVVNFSRWRWFEFGPLAAPRWIGPAPATGRLVLFDRNTTTGQTLRLLRSWLERDGYDVLTIGHLDRGMSSFGVQFLDYVWDDSEGYDKLGLACEAQGGVRIIPVSEYNTSALSGVYTFCVIGGRRDELQGSDAAGASFDLRATPIATPRSVVFQNVPSWEEAMLLGYINQKPLITIAGSDEVVADYSVTDSLGDIVAFLAQETAS